MSSARSVSGVVPRPPRWRGAREALGGGNAGADRVDQNAIGSGEIGEGPGEVHQAGVGDAAGHVVEGGVAGRLGPGRLQLGGRLLERLPAPGAHSHPTPLGAA